MERQLIDVRARRREPDRADARSGRDLVDGADDRQDRRCDVGQRDEPALDHEAALEHPVVSDELSQEVGHRGARPRNPPLGLEKAPLAFPREQRFAVVELKDEVDPATHRLDRVEQPKAGPARPGGQCHAAEDPVGEHAGGAGRELLGQAERHGQARVDRAAERDQRSEALVAAVRRGLVAEHPALRVARQVHVLPSCLADPVDGVGDGEYVVGERALESTLLPLRRAEVDDPGVGAVLAEDRDRARRRRHVVHLGGEHHRRDKQDRRTVVRRRRRAVAAGRRRAALLGRRVIPPQAVDALLGDDLVRGGLLVGRQSAKPRDLERILGRGSEPADRPGDLLRQEVHWNPGHVR